MPYFVYRVQEKPRKLDHLETFSSYREARSYVREQRQQNDEVETVRMIFARNDIEAEKLLSTPRDERVIGED
ncbi:MAG: hypothetical protein ABFR19_01845 [Pseudomonadota bacterium]